MAQISSHVPKLWFPSLECRNTMSWKPRQLRHTVYRYILSHRVADSYVHPHVRERNSLFQRTDNRHLEPMGCYCVDWWLNKTQSHSPCETVVLDWILISGRRNGTLEVQDLKMNLIFQMHRTLSVWMLGCFIWFWFPKGVIKKVMTAFYIPVSQMIFNHICRAGFQ